MLAPTPRAPNLLECRFNKTTHYHPVDFLNQFYLYIYTVSPEEEEEEEEWGLNRTLSM